LFEVEVRKGRLKMQNPKMPEQIGRVKMQNYISERTKIRTGLIVIKILIVHTKWNILVH